MPDLPNSMRGRATARKARRKPATAGLLAGASVAVLAVLFAPTDASASPARHRIDEEDVQRLRLAHPDALTLLETGETLAMAGNTEQALAQFREAGALAPQSALVARRECQALTFLGRRSEAGTACLRAIRSEGSAMDMRAMVAVLMSGNGPPTTSELAQAMRFARSARDTMPQEPWGYAAECDVAERIGDAQMLERCLVALKYVAPDNYETVRAFALAAPHCVTWQVWTGWAAIAILGIATGVHGGWRKFRRLLWRRRATATALVLVVAAGYSAPNSARADEGSPPPQSPSHEGVLERSPPPQGPSHQGMLSDWPVDDQDPESSVPTNHKRDRNPLQFGYWLMDLTYKAVQATKRGDHAGAVKFYKALVKAVPDRSVSFTRLCESYEAMGDWKDAVETCATALTRDGVTIRDYEHYFSLALAKKGSLTASEIGVLNDVIQHLREDPAGADAASDLACQLAVRIEDVTRLQTCAAALAAKAPDDPRTLSYELALALKRGNLKEAEALVERARTTEMAPAGIEQMEREIASIRAARKRRMFAWGLGGLATSVGAGMVIVLATRRRARAPLASP
jgi:tetratricopeptide (TPR) repeat protein